MRSVSSGGSSWAIHTEWVQAASGQVDTGSDMSDSDDEAVEERTCNLAKLAEEYAAYNRLAREGQLWRRPL